MRYGLALLLSVLAWRAAADSPGTSSVPGADVTHIVYLHGSIVEGTDPRPRHPQWGIYEYHGVIAALEARGFAVESEQRPARTVPADYAAKVAAQVRGLLQRGIPAARIVVMGHSKGGEIARQAAIVLDEPQLRWVFLANCFSGLPEDFRFPPRSLSMRDDSDTAAVSCRPWLPSGTEEIEFATGRGHGLFYQPDAIWLDRLEQWLEATAKSDDPKLAASVEEP